MASKKSPLPVRAEELALANHSYAAKAEVAAAGTSKRKDPFSPAKNSPVIKKKDARADDDSDCMSAVLDAIRQLTDKIDTLGSQLQQNSGMLANIAKAVEFNAAEIKDCKTRLQSTEKEMAAVKKDNTELLERVLELERYKRRWNLKIRGLKEKDGENIREVVTSLLVKISPSWAPSIHHIVDSVHRLGRHMENQSRHVIIQFTQRLHRDELWRITKDSAVCKEMRITFIEDLCKADRESRATVWPKIQQARAEGKRAYYRGGSGYINGQKIT